MDFSQFASKISKVQQMPLPGEAAQLKMAPLERLQELKRKAIEAQSARRAGVMVLFYPDAQVQTRFALILRKTYKGVHSAQIGFPGGSYEKQDENLMQTALRETEEEVGLPRTCLTVVGRLDDIFTVTGETVVTPVVAFAKYGNEQVPDDSVFKFIDDRIEAQKKSLNELEKDDPLTTRMIGALGQDAAFVLPIYKKMTSAGIPKQYAFPASFAIGSNSFVVGL